MDHAARTFPPSHFAAIAAATAALGTALAALVAGPLPALSDKALRDAGISRAAQTPPVAQDAATALHLQSLGQWH
ncbi:MAG: hypothetical protein AAFP13_08760 [Pseudomonadota bacterium]